MINESSSDKKYPKLILGLDISTACIGIAIIYDDGETLPQIELISHVSPKISKDIKGIEALILRKDIFVSFLLLNKKQKELHFYILYKKKLINIHQNLFY